MIDADRLLAFINDRIRDLESNGGEIHLRECVADHLMTDSMCTCGQPEAVDSDWSTMQQLVELHRPQMWCGTATCMTCMESVPPFEHRDWPCQTLAIIGARWRDHPDYDPTWSPA